MRSKIVLGSLLGAVAIHAAFLACSGPSGHDGGSVVDAIVDGEVRDANAQSMPMEAQCAAVGDGTRFVATFNVVGFDPRGTQEPLARVCGASVATYGSSLYGIQGADCASAGVIMQRDRIDVVCNADGDVVRLSIR